MFGTEYIYRAVLDWFPPMEVFALEKRWVENIVEKGENVFKRYLPRIGKKLFVKCLTLPSDTFFEWTKFKAFADDK